MRGGFDEERAERQRMKEEEAERDAKQMSFMRGIREAALARRQAAEAQANGARSRRSLAPPKLGCAS